MSILKTKTLSGNDYLISDTRKSLVNSSAEAVVHWLAMRDCKTIVSTSFGPYSAVLLKIVCNVAPETPVIWVDTGLNTPQTYQFVDRLCATLNLNLFTYHPRRSAAHRDAVLKREDANDEVNRESVADELKLEPFQRALTEHAPDFWINGIRHEDNEYRKTLGKVSQGPDNIIKVAPLYDWTEDDLSRFISAHALPNERHYFDPTKVIPSRECGLHNRL